MIQTIRKWQREFLDFTVRNNPGLGLDARAEAFVRLFGNRIPTASRVLDIGGGWGFYHAPFEKRGHSLTVLDVVKPGLQKCPVVIYGGGRIPFPDKSFDVSLLITVLHHIPDIDEVIAEARRVTRGRLIVVEDLYHHLPGRWWTILRDQIYNMEFFGHPKNFRTRDEWIHLFTASGFDLVETREIYTWLAGLRILNGILVFDVK